jgi:hypothetical protein
MFLNLNLNFLTKKEKWEMKKNYNGYFKKKFNIWNDSWLSKSFILVMSKLDYKFKVTQPKQLSTKTKIKKIKAKDYKSTINRQEVLCSSHSSFFLFPCLVLSFIAMIVNFSILCLSLYFSILKILCCHKKFSLLIYFLSFTDHRIQNSENSPSTEVQKMNENEMSSSSTSLMSSKSFTIIYSIFFSLLPSFSRGIRARNITKFLSFTINTNN